jgi:hypothetical protein
MMSGTLSAARLAAWNRRTLGNPETTLQFGEKSAITLICPAAGRV